MFRSRILRPRPAHELTYLDLTRRRWSSRMLAGALFGVAAAAVLLASISALAAVRPAALPSASAHTAPITSATPARLGQQPAPTVAPSPTTRSLSVPRQVATVAPTTNPPPTVDRQRRATLLAAEDRRISAVRATTMPTRQRDSAWRAPYRVPPGAHDASGADTLVLTASERPYTVVDLLRLAPRTFVRQPDGGYLLTENIYLAAGATLRLSRTGGLTLRLASSPDRFVSIVADGGSTFVAGTRTAPTVITSWNPANAGPDRDVSDGRAYVRSIGGKVLLSYATEHDLGF